METPALDSRSETTLEEDVEKASLSQFPTASTASPERSRSHSLTRSRSFATDGFSCYNLGQDEIEDSEPAQRIPTSAFEVQWDGKDDPMSPRNFNPVRKWLIVIIVSSCSFCV